MDMKSVRVFFCPKKRRAQAVSDRAWKSQRRGHGELYYNCKLWQI